MAVVLTAQSIAGLKSRSAPYHISDALVPGLQVRVGVDGDKSWSVRYTIGARLRRFTIGKASDLTLAKARTRARDARAEASAGVDPATQKQERRTADSMEDLCTTYLTWAEKHKRSWAEDKRRLHRYVLKAWRHSPVKDITRRDVKRLLASIAAPVEANRTQALISKLFSYALDEEIVSTHPCIRLKKHKEQSRNRVLSHDEVRTFWQACEDMPSTMRAAFRLRLVTAQRGREVVTLRWQDVDLQSAWWTIPAEYSKNRLPHRVPLSSLAVDILTALRVEADTYAEAHPHAKTAIFVLQGSRGKRQRRSASKAFTIPDFVPHDLRRTAATYMTSSGTPRLVVQKVLNHAEQGITSVYDRASYDLEKRQALDRWATVLTSIIEKKDGATVLPFVVPA